MPEYSIKRRGSRDRIYIRTRTPQGWKQKLILSVPSSFYQKKLSSNIKELVFEQRKERETIKRIEEECSVISPVTGWKGIHYPDPWLKCNKRMQPHGVRIIRLVEKEMKVAEKLAKFRYLSRTKPGTEPALRKELLRTKLEMLGLH
jgi:tRNA-dihydrouridine synthase